MNELIQLALEAGASQAAVIAASEISIEDGLAGLCASPRCENLGLSKSCPPHVAGPSSFREWLKAYDHAIVVKIDVPMDILLSDERRHVMKLLHEIAARVEEAAVKQGHPHARGFAGGGCKPLFCEDHAQCRVISGEGRCRHPHQARESMSGFGINVQKLITAAGWPANTTTKDADRESDAMTWVAGLILVD